MDFKQIQELIKLINDSNIGEVTIEQKDLKLTIRQKEEAAGVQMVAAPPAQLSYAPQPQQQTASAASDTTAASAASAEASAATTVTIKSPMIGTFYKRPAPDKPDFVSPGDEISVGKVVCIIEAMKLFNEIESEVAMVTVPPPDIIGLGSFFCLMVTFLPSSSIVTSPMLDLLTIFINSCICLKSILAFLF